MPPPPVIAPWSVLPSPQSILATKSDAQACESVVENEPTPTLPVASLCTALSGFTVTATVAGATTHENVALAVPPTGSMTVTVALVVPTAKLVGVPLMSPVAWSIANPSGKVSTE